MRPFAFQGIVAAPFLPMLPDFSIDWDGLRSYLRWIAGGKPTAIAMNMDASEGPALTRDEQLEVLRVSREAIGDVPLVSGLVCGSTADAVAWGRELRDGGADALAVFPPMPAFLGSPIPAEMVVRFHAAIAEGVGLPIIGFQFPVAWGPNFPPETLVRLAALPQFLGIKEASFDTSKTLEAIDTARRLPRKIGIMTGSDTFILEAMIMGCDGALIGFAGTATDRLVAMQAAVAARDYATAHAIWDALGPLARHVWRPPIRDFRPRMKELLVMQGRFRHATVRPPQLGVDDADRAEIRRLAIRAGLVEGPRQAAE